jgi:predicted metal-dependent phosphotriesterase family hydrolase
VIEIRTVTGPISPDLLGITLPHEHVYIQMWHLRGRNDYAGQYEDDQLLCAELGAFRELGGRSIVDCTVNGIGRQPERLRELSQRTGLYFVMGCGWYREPYYPPEDEIDRRPVNELAEQLIAEIRSGVGQTGIRPGIIGEVGTDKWWVSSQEERVHRAAARAQKSTGLAITTHSIGKPSGVLELDIFEEEKVDPSRVVIGHCDLPHSLFIDYHLEILRRGAYVQFDTFGAKPPEIEGHALKIFLELLSRGYEQRLLISQDVCKIQHLRAFGGNGFSYVLASVVPRLLQAGVSKEAVHTILVDNPRRVLTIEGPDAG